MHTKTKMVILSVTGLFTLLYACTSGSNASVSSQNKEISAARNKEKDELIKRGRYLNTIAGCNDCHSPKTFTPQGPMIDTTSLMSGHPATTKLPPVDPKVLNPGQWVNMSGDVTAFAGPWGISYAANLTPDSATGIGAWSEETFVKTLRTGKHLGLENGRPILPPMPWFNIAQMTDEDISALYAFLRSIPPVNNRVPAPVAPNEISMKKQ
jgi:mono/diheme cytochrome c family protein